MSALESAQSAPITAMAADTLAPAQPTGVAYTVAQGKVSLTWSAVTQSDLITNNFNGDAVKSQFTLTYGDVATGSYVVKVGGVTQVEGTDFTIDKGAPATPAVITFLAGKIPATGTNNVVVTYRQVLKDLAGYRVYRKNDAGSAFAAIATVSATVAAQVTTYDDTTMFDGASYIYAVSSIDNEPTPNESPKSADVSAKSIPSVPANLVATTGDTMIRVTWNKVTDVAQPKKNENLAGYKVYRKLAADAGAHAFLAQVAAGTSLYDDSTVTNGTNYSYVISSIDNSL